MDELKQEVRDTVGLVLVVARETEGLSPADLKAVAQEAALAAMSRTRGGQSPSVTQDDFDEALGRISGRGEAAGFWHAPSRRRRRAASARRARPRRGDRKS